MSKTFSILTAAAALLAATGALAQEAANEVATEGEIDATFTWSSIDLADTPAGEDRMNVLGDVLIVITANKPGPLDRLVGSCLTQSVNNTKTLTYRLTGTCTLVDAEGDMVFETIEETDGKGEATITGGTGKFAGLTGEYTLESTWYGSIRPGMNQGTGRKMGAWRRATQ